MREDGTYDLIKQKWFGTDQTAVAGAQGCAGKLRVVRRIGEVLGFEAESAVLLAGLARFADHGAIEIVAAGRAVAVGGARDRVHTGTR